MRPETILSVPAGTAALEKRRGCAVPAGHGECELEVLVEAGAPGHRVTSTRGVMKPLWSIAALAALVLAACHEPIGSDDDPRPEDQLTFVRFTAESPPAVTQASMWAVHGQTRTLVIRYAGQPESEPPLLEFRVDALSLLRRPNGLPFLPGDSVLITVTTDPLGRFLFDFQPAGLVFSPLIPAVLRLNHNRADPDLNGDGVVDQQDAALDASLRIWTEPSLSLLFVPIPTLRIPILGIELFEGQVTHFTGFALAS
jgi:hypothetical protein